MQKNANFATKHLKISNKKGLIWWDVSKLIKSLWKNSKLSKSLKFRCSRQFSALLSTCSELVLATWPRCARAHLLRPADPDTGLCRSLPCHFTCTQVSCLPPMLHSACQVITGPGFWVRLRYKIRTRGTRRACDPPTPSRDPDSGARGRGVCLWTRHPPPQVHTSPVSILSFAACIGACTGL